MARGRAGGVAALHNRKSPGAPVRLTAAQRSGIPALLAKRAEAWGFRGAIWTRARGYRDQTRFNVTYHPDHVGRILPDLGWSVHKPRERATQRTEAAIDHWRKQKWQTIKKKLSAKTAPWSG